MDLGRSCLYSHTMETTRVQAQSGKKPYSPPKLVTYGTVAELTRGANLQVGDGFAGDPGNGTVNPPGQS